MHTRYFIFTLLLLSLTGFVEKEIKKAKITMLDTGENPEVPFPRDMIDLEVNALILLNLNRDLHHLQVSSSDFSACLSTGHIRED